MFSDLLEPDYGIDNSPKDDTAIIQVLFYFSEEEAARFKKLVKEGMRREWSGESLFKDANVSDLILLILERLYGKQQSPKDDAEAFLD